MHSRSLALVGVPLAAVLVGGLWWLVGRSQSPEEAVARAAEPTPSLVTAGVELRVLTASVIGRGDVVPEVAVAVGAPSSIEGAGVVTGVDAAVGDEVVEGARVVEVSGRPVFVLAGEVPVYRALRPGMKGADVAQLQAALTRLGFIPDGDGLFGELTKTALTAMYEKAGYSPVPASTDSVAAIAAGERALAEAEAGMKRAEAALVKAGLGPDAVQLAGAQASVNDAKRGLTDADAGAVAGVADAESALVLAQTAFNRVRSDPAAEPGALDEAIAAVERAERNVVAARRAGSGAVAAAKERLSIAELQLGEVTKPPDVSEPQAARDAAMLVRDAAVTALSEVAAAAGPTVPQGEVVFVPTLPARVQSAVTTLGPIGASPAGGGGEQSNGGNGNLVVLSAGDLVVSMTVRMSDQGLVRAGLEGEVLDELSGNTYRGVVQSVAADAVAGFDGQFGFPAVLTVPDGLPAKLAGTNVRVTFTAASSDGEVLVVPVAAVSSTADGKERVTVVREGLPVDVSVTAGLSADGFVAVEPVDTNGLVVGDRVVVGR